LPCPVPDLLARPVKGWISFVELLELNTRSLHVDHDGSVQQRQRQHADRRNCHWGKGRKPSRPTSHKTVHGSSTPVPTIKNRTQHVAAQEIETVRLIHEQGCAGSPFKLMVDRRCGNAVGAMALRHQQFGQTEHRGLSAAAHRTEQSEPRSYRKPIEHVGVENP
jgi:hypothetical protein